MESSTVSKDFVSLFPFYLSLTSSISPDYFIIGRAGKRYDSSTFTKKFTFLEGDIALLEDYTYAIFKKPTVFESNSAYIGNINNFDEIIEDVSTNADRNDKKLLFENEQTCSPYLLGINSEIENIVNLDKEDEVRGQYCIGYNVDGHCKGLEDDYYYYGIINFSTRGTKKLNEVPPIYLNNTYLSDDCKVEQDGYSIKCKIKEEKWKNNCTYKVNELYEGCYGPIFTSIFIRFPYVKHHDLFISSENINICLFYLLLIYSLLFY